MHITYLINKREPEAFEYADRLREAGIEFSVLPTSGISTLVVDGIACYGPSEIEYAVNYLISQKQDDNICNK